MKRVIGSIEVPMPCGLVYHQPLYEEVPDADLAQHPEGDPQNGAPAGPNRGRIIGRPEGIPRRQG